MLCSTKTRQEQENLDGDVGVHVPRLHACPLRAVRTPQALVCVYAVHLLYCTAVTASSTAA